MCPTGLEGNVAIYCLPHMLNLYKKDISAHYSGHWPFFQCWLMNELQRMALHLQVVNETLDYILTSWPSCVAFWLLGDTNHTVF